MCGMRPNADKLVAFYRGLAFLIGAGEEGENRQMLEKSCISSRFGFILMLQNCKQQMQTWNFFFFLNNILQLHKTDRFFEM